MKRKRTITVTVKPGHRLPLPRGTQAGPGGTTKILTEDDVVELPLDTFVRRRVRAGDLVETTVERRRTVKPTTTAAPKKEA